MSRSALDVAKEALALFRQVNGSESLSMQCQRFDGYYWQWAWSGTERGIAIYPTAQKAAEASTMLTTDVNSPRVQPGDQIFWEFGTEGHVATVIGRSIDGRVLVTHTGARGQDVVLALGQSVVVSHADTIRRTVIGVSRTNGANTHRTGLTAWPETTPAPTPTPGEEEDEDMAQAHSMETTKSGKNIQAVYDREGFFTEWEGGNATYNQNIRAQHGVATLHCIVPESHYDAIKRSVLAKASSTVKLETPVIPVLPEKATA